MGLVNVPPGILSYTAGKAGTQGAVPHGGESPRHRGSPDAKKERSDPWGCVTWGLVNVPPRIPSCTAGKAGTPGGRPTWEVVSAPPEIPGWK
jgi:hypothetical protein